MKTEPIVILHMEGDKPSLETIRRRISLSWFCGSKLYVLVIGSLDPHRLMEDILSAYRMTDKVRFDVYDVTLTKVEKL